MLDIKEIEKIIPQRAPFLMIDKVEEYVPGESAIAYKNVNINEWYFQGHFPGNPIMPGVLITEALAQTGAVAIDVNSGKFTGKSTLEETVYKVNYEATIEIAKQLRLRDIGGIIIIDYIDMQKQENKEKIEKLLKESLKQDRAKTQVEGFTKLNLMELTRKHICSHKG